MVKPSISAADTHWHWIVALNAPKAVQTYWETESGCESSITFEIVQQSRGVYLAVTVVRQTEREGVCR